MNLCLFFEGTGQGVAGNFTNVTRLRDLCRDDAAQRLHLESGPGTHFGAYVMGAIAGTDGQLIFRNARRWIEKNYQSLPPPLSNSRSTSTSSSTSTFVYLFGFSRGALLARHFAAWLDKLGVTVAYLGLWDTVDATPGLEVAETCPANVRVARHALARDEARRFFAPVPLRAGAKHQRVTEMLFPGSHSDVGGFYEDNHAIADVALAWIAAGAVREGLRLKSGVTLRQQAKDPPVTHDAHTLASNLWGALDRVPRALGALRLHPSFR